MDATYNLNGGFKPTMKRFADLDGPDFFPTPAWATYALIENERFAAGHLGKRLRKRRNVSRARSCEQQRDQLGPLRPRFWRGRQGLPEADAGRRQHRDKSALQRGRRLRQKRGEALPTEVCAPAQAGLPGGREP